VLQYAVCIHINQLALVYKLFVRTTVTHLDCIMSVNVNYTQSVYKCMLQEAQTSQVVSTKCEISSNVVRSMVKVNLRVNS